MKTIGKCKYCKDPIYDFQPVFIVDKGFMHKGCYFIFYEETGVNPLMSIWGRWSGDESIDELLLALKGE